MSTQPYSPDDQATIRQETPRMHEAPRMQETPRMPEWNTRTAPIATVQAPRSVGIGVDAGKLWAGGAATAVVTGLVALVGVLVSRWIFHLPVLAPTQDGAYGDVRTTALIVIAMVAAIVATGLMHVLMLGTLRPMLFFGWIGALFTAITVMYPFSTTASMDAKIGTAVVNLAICLAALTLVAGVASRSVPEPVPTRRPRSLPVSDYTTYN
jgi:Family of unknown function (DUF6069)